MSNLKFLATVKSYEDADKFLDGKQARRLGHNTYVERGDNVIAVRYHSTNIVTYVPGDVIVLRANGWVTSTTANRMHMLTPDNVRIGRKQGEFLISDEVGTNEAWDGYEPYTVFA